MPAKPQTAALVAPVTVTVQQTSAWSNIQHNALYDAFGAGDVDTVLVGTRRLVIWQSVLDYIERLRLGIERDPAEKQAAADAYARSLNGPTGRATAKARAGLVRKQQAVEQSRASTRKPIRQPEKVACTSPLPRGGRP
jgi:hypothetical protein